MSLRPCCLPITLSCAGVIITISTAQSVESFKQWEDQEQGGRREDIKKQQGKSWHRYKSSTSRRREEGENFLLNSQWEFTSLRSRCADANKWLDWPSNACIKLRRLKILSSKIFSPDKNLHKFLCCWLILQCWHSGQQVPLLHSNICEWWQNTCNWLTEC
jgi:hypothetical protein